MIELMMSVKGVVIMVVIVMVGIVVMVMMIVMMSIVMVAVMIVVMCIVVIGVMIAVMFFMMGVVMLAMMLFVVSLMVPFVMSFVVLAGMPFVMSLVVGFMVLPVPFVSSAVRPAVARRCPAERDHQTNGQDRYENAACNGHEVPPAQWGIQKLFSRKCDCVL